MSNFINYHTAYIERTLAAGSHTVDVYICGNEKNRGIPAQVNVVASPNDSGGTLIASLVA